MIVHQWIARRGVIIIESDISIIKYTTSDWSTSTCY